ncbi:esterase-like activity of phytase family protein [Acaryochloris sp. CCMEE 5410]|uniref:esterase-like activity of phytase family protein n=1 Tax=Acaryochloris sp. CCMEE 5410 TaxID=310037 RepID=UPI0021CE27A3|nr:esterase-like activity of phytase family protein [Acaryochloris sp. CCMEE 5410]
MQLIDGKTASPSYVKNIPGSPKYQNIPLLTVGDEVPLLEGEFGNLTPSETVTFAFAGIPDGIGYNQIDGLNYVWVNHELGDSVTTDISSTQIGQINGARVSLYIFDENWDVIGGRNLINDVVIDGETYSLNIETGNYETADGTVLNLRDHDNLSRFCSAYLASMGFVDDSGTSIPIYLTGEEVSDGLGFAITPDGTAIAIEGLGTYSKEQVYSPVQYRAGNPSGKTVLIGMEDFGDGEIYMYVGEQTAEDPNGFTDVTESLYVLRVEDSQGNVFSYEDMPENEELIGKWVLVPDDVTLDKDPSVLSDWVNATDENGVYRSTNFRRPEDIHEDPNNPGAFYFVTTGRSERNGSLTEEAATPEEADNPYGKLHRFILNPDDPTGDMTFEFLMSGGPNTGVSYDNMTVDAQGNVIIQEDRTAFGRDVLNDQQSHGRVLSYNIAANEGVVGDDQVQFLLENNTAKLDPTQATNYGDWESSGIVDVGDGAYLLDVQAHSIRDAQLPDGTNVGLNDDGNGDIQFYEGRYAQGGQLILSVPVDTPELEGFASLPADTFADGPPAGGDNGNGGPIDANGRTGPFDGQPVQGFSGVQFADSDGSFWFLSDNGFGAKTNSSDYLLRLYKVDPSFAGSEGGDGSVEVEDFIQLSDPNNLIPFEIQNESTSERQLTGSDFDIESFVIDGNGDIWVGEEFGPYLLHFNSDGELIEAPTATPNPLELNTLNGQDPIVIGHRGASGILPEHTLEAYATAIAQGADFIEPDLVITKDGVLIARHEPLLDDTTNIADVFGPERMSTKILDGVETTGYFAEDFTLEEIKMLRAVQSRDFRSQDFNGAFEIPTLKEVIELVQEVEANTGTVVGIYPETKHPTFFDLQDLSLEEPLIATLQETGFTDPSRLFIQSFEFQNLIELQGMLDAEGLGDIPLVQLYGNTTASASPDSGFSVPYDIRYNVEQGNDLAAIYGQDFLDAAENALSENTIYSDLDNPEILQIISEKYAEGAGPWKNNFLLREALDTPVDGNGDGNAEITTQLTGKVTSFVDDAHAAGLQVHPYTLRNEERFLTLNADGTPQTPEEEIKQLIDIGVDGFFTDFPGTGDAVRDQIVADVVRSPDNPDVLAGDEVSNLLRSRGFEGMAISPDRMTLYPMLEGTVEGDPEGSLRIYEFDVASGQYEGLVGRYQLEDPSHAIGDFTVINQNEYLVIERDGNQGDEAAFKQIFKVDLSQVDANGFVYKEELVDLLNIDDPNDLNGDGDNSFKFPFVTIEDVLVVDEDTLVVANDNNYPFSVGRGPDIDNNEIIQIKLNESLDLDPRVGLAGLDRFGFSGTQFDTVEPSQMVGLEDYTVDPVFTIGETYGGYTPPGILDGLGAFELDDDTVRILANHELRSAQGYAYELANGTELTGARVSYFDIDKETRTLVGTGLAYDTVINREGEEVDEASDLEFDGINRLCSSQYIEAEQFGEGRGLKDALYFTGEEANGGTEFVLDPETNTLHAVPWMGRAAWESVTELDTGTTDKVALLVGDDRGAAPLLLYVGTKETSEGAGVLERNGLVGGKLYVWAADSGELTPEEFNGTFESRAGTWVEINIYDPNQAGTAVDSNADGDIQDEMGYDALGFATQAQQDALAEEAGAFQFSRPEDVATNPEDGTQAVLASTGRDSLFPADSWGTTYIVDTDFGTDGLPATAEVKAIYDGDDSGNGQFEGSDFGLRSPDNLDWGDDGHIYIQEDRSFSEFGLTSGEEASIWKLDPDSGELTRIAQMDRSALPLGQTDGDPTDIGDWESSGILDVSELFGEDPGNLFVFDVQAHSLRDGVIEDANLVQGGQLPFLEAPEEPEPEPINFDTMEPAQMVGLEEYTVDPVFTVGETVGDYTPPGILDGLGAFELDDDTVRVLANHELRSAQGYAYELANGTELIGARVSYFDIDKETRTIVDTGLAYDTIINREGEVVDEASDLEFEGINRLCSSQYIEAEQFGEGRGLTDGLYFTGEEANGGTEFVLDPDTNTLHALPWLGRAAWESVTELDTGTTDKVALLVGDDRGAAPLLLYVGTKDSSEGAGVLERNGLVGGKLYVWAADSGELTPEEFNGTFESRAGSWVEINIYDPDQADTAVDTNADGDIQDEMGYDAQGFATQAQQDALAEAAGAFQFSRPEDVATNPEDGTQAVLASTGRDSLFPSDSWGTTYIIDTEFGPDGLPATAEINAIYDGDDAGGGQFEGADFGLRSPDNLDWGDDGHIYIQEDRSFSEFGLTSGEEASIWKLDPDSGELTRIAQMDRSAVPTGQTDSDPTDIGDWESSGILDVSELFGEEAGELFIFDVQAHSLTDGIIEEANLVQGGQLAFLEAPEMDPSDEGDEGDMGDDGDGDSPMENSQGSRGNDLLAGGPTDDDFNGGRGDDTITGGLGDDNIIGGRGNDLLEGGLGDDDLFGGRGLDTLNGNEGSDILVGGRGNDLLTGGSGEDLFALAAGDGTDTITDFVLNEDVFGLVGDLTFEQLIITQGVGAQASDTLISVSATDEILAVLSGVQADTVTSSVFEPFTV